MKPFMINNRPHWRSTFPQFVWMHYESFATFMAETWSFLGLPPPTRAQREVANYLQHGLDSSQLVKLSKQDIAIAEAGRRECVIRAFRSLGKSYIAAAFVIWRLMRQPRDEKVLVISASGSKSREFVHQLRSIILAMPLVSWMLEGNREEDSERRDTSIAFDIAHSSLSQSYSVKAVGLTGQITGSRATLIIADDIEVEENCRTEDARARLLMAVQNDFSAIVKTEQESLGDIVFLGTPRVQFSLYNTLVSKMGYTCFTVPILYPTAERRPNYLLKTDRMVTKDILAPYLIDLFNKGLLTEGDITDTRFSREEVNVMQSQGVESFTLNMLLDTSLSDLERFPLKLYDLMIHPLIGNQAPISIAWGKVNILHSLPNVGLTNDFFVGPAAVSEQVRPFEQTIMFVDPSGRGADESAWAIVSSLNGFLYIRRVRGTRNPEEAYKLIAFDAKNYEVHTIFIEPNFGGGSWMYALQPILYHIYPAGCSVQESEWAKGRKETRIIDTLEPALLQHRLVVDANVVQDDLKLPSKHSLFYQMTHITRDAGAIAHDDRIDAVAGAVAYFMKHLALDTNEQMRELEEYEAERFFQEYLEATADPRLTYGIWDDGRLMMKTRDGQPVYTSNL